MAIRLRLYLKRVHSPPFPDPLDYYTTHRRLIIPNWCPRVRGRASVTPLPRDRSACLWTLLCFLAVAEEAGRKLCRYNTRCVAAHTLRTICFGTQTLLLLSLPRQCVNFILYTIKPEHGVQYSCSINTYPLTFPKILNRASETKAVPASRQGTSCKTCTNKNMHGRKN